MYKSFESIQLLKKEKKSLRTFIFHKRQYQENIECFYELWHDYGFIGLNFSNERNIDGERITDGSYSLTDRYFRYKVYRREILFQNLPNWVAITISFVSLGLSILIWL